MSAPSAVPRPPLPTPARTLAMRRQVLAAAIAIAVAHVPAASGHSLEAARDKDGTSLVGQPIPQAIDVDRYRSPGSRRKVLVPVRHRAALAGVALVARTDYESFSLVETDDARAAERLRGAVPADYLNLILLDAAALDTRSHDAVQLAARTATFVDGKAMWLVQFSGPVTAEGREALQRTGVTVVTAMPFDAYLVYGDADQSRRLQSLRRQRPDIQFLAPYAAEQRIGPEAAADAGGTIGIQLLVDADVNDATLTLLGGEATGPVHSFRSGPYLNLQTAVRAGAVAALAGRPDVVSIHAVAEPSLLDERQARIVAGALIDGQPTADDHLAWLRDKGFTQAQFDASGFSVNLSDSGVDNGTTTPNHFALYRFGDLAQGSRIAYNRLVGTAHAGGTATGADGHGTVDAHIVAGFVPGDPPFDRPQHADSSGFRHDLGIAPFVRLGVSVIFDPQFTYPDPTALERDAYRDGARISSNSWGASTPAYDARAQVYDGLVRDTDPATAGDQPMVIVFSAGNSGPAEGTMGNPANAKNLIAVGASENVRALGTDRCGTGDSDADNAYDMASFSSSGPAIGGRRKPDLVAPGTHVIGGVWQSEPPPPTDSLGLAASGYLGSGICGGQNSIFAPAGQQWYTASTGTSHAAPAVSGAAALMRQFFINRGLAPPSPAMTKALMLNTTRYMTGTGARDDLWSNRQGMGLIDLDGMFAPSSRILRDQQDSDVFTASGQSRTFVGRIVEAGRPLRITLAWTDAPGPTNAAPQLNDLDLQLVIDGQTYLGNRFVRSSSVPGGPRDAANNVESVFLPDGLAAGTPFAITVAATNLVADGVPDKPGPIDQDFALVAGNAAAESRALFAIEALDVESESADPPNGLPDPQETLGYRLTLRNVGDRPSAAASVTLLEQDGVVAAGAPVHYAPVAAGESADGLFTFTIDRDATCGAMVSPTWIVDDDAGAYRVTRPLRIGEPLAPIAEDFDDVVAPALPAPWSTQASGTAAAPWETTVSRPTSSPNAAFVPSPKGTADSSLVSPAFATGTGPAEVAFANDFSFEPGWDGGVLEISIDDAPFVDLLEAGGQFLEGGYTGVLGAYSGCSEDPNPLARRPAWTGFGRTITRALLPPAAAGQPVRLRWRMGSDCNGRRDGWRVDDVAIQPGYRCAAAQTAFADLSIAVDDGRASASTGMRLDYAVAVRNTGPQAVTGARVVTQAIAGLSNLQWRCEARGNAACAHPSGTGALDETVDLGAAGDDAIEFHIEATVAETSEERPITLSAAVSAPSGVIDDRSADNQASDTDALVLFADGFD